MKTCPYCQSQQIIKKGFYFIKHSRSHIRRLQCLTCKKTFSSRTFSSNYHQKKPFLNSIIFNLLVSGNTQRRVARLLNCSKNTVERKLLWLSQNPILSSDFKNEDFKHIQIDELETIEHTKLKPLTVPVCVSHNYKILGLSVGRIKAKGHLAEISFKKYGAREDERLIALKELFESIKQKTVIEPMSITTDQSPFYVKMVKAYFPHSKHIQINSGEQVKKKKELLYLAERKKIFDPMFALNQRFAMLRSDIRRLTRRSWCTTKKIENLKHHLNLYAVYNNYQLSF
jgi:transposase-like protein/IS1 family transposase